MPPIRLGAAVAAVCVTGGAWAALCLLLWSGGHAPSATLVPLPAADYYLWQAVFVTPLLVVQWVLLSVTAHVVARALGGTGRLRTTTVGLAFTFALPLLALFIVADLLTYLVAGFGALAVGSRIYGTATIVAVLLASSSLLRTVHRLSVPRATAAAFVGLVLQAAVGSPLLR